MEFLWGRNSLFLKFLNEPMQKESDFGGRKYCFQKFRASTGVYLRPFTIKIHSNSFFLLYSNIVNTSINQSDK